MEVDEELRESERTGEVVLGSNETLEATQSGESQLTVISSSAPREVEEKLREYTSENDISLYYYPGGSEDLGLALGKPFSVSVLAVLDSGDSGILELEGVKSGD